MNQIILSPTGTPVPVVQDVDYDRSLRRSGRVALIALFVLLFGFVAAAAIVPMGGAVMGQGQLGAETRVKRVAHPTGGVIAEIRVRDGQTVKRGQILMRLDTSVSGISADLSGQSVDQLAAQRARLIAEQENRTTIRFPDELLRRSDRSAQTAMATETRLLALRLIERQGQRAQLAERIRQYDQQISGYSAQIAALNSQQALIKPEREGVQDLYRKGFVTLSRLNQLERTAVDMDGSIGSLRASIAQARARITETREQIIAIDQNARSEAGAAYVQVTSALNDQRVRNADAGDAFERSVIVAPYDGVIDKLAFSTVGGVVQPAETIMEIVPANDRLVAEGSISPTDIDRVRTGQRARVRLSAFSAQTTPEIPGHVIFVSPERTVNEKTGASFYRVHVQLDERVVARERLELKPGMPAEMFVSTGSRSMLSYVTKPLRDQFQRAFND